MVLSKEYELFGKGMQERVGNGPLDMGGKVRKVKCMGLFIPFRGLGRMTRLDTWHAYTGAHGTTFWVRVSSYHWVRLQEDKSLGELVLEWSSEY